MSNLRSPLSYLQTNTLYAELDGHANIAYDAESSNIGSYRSVAQITRDLLSQFGVQGSDKVFEVYAESTAHISQFQYV